MLDSSGNASSIGPINTGTIDGDFPAATNAYACLQASNGIRYRGANNQLFVYNESDSSSWTENFTTAYIKDIEEDNSGNIWIATNGNGIDIRN